MIHTNEHPQQTRHNHYTTTPMISYPVNVTSIVNNYMRVSKLSIPNPINYKYTINIDAPHSFEISGRPDISDMLATQSVIARPLK